MIWPQLNTAVRQRKKDMCGSSYLTYPKFLPPTQNIVSTNSEVRRNMYQNDHLKQKSKFQCIQSLVLEVKGLKQGYMFRNRPFYVSFVQADLNILRKKENLFPTFPNFFQGVTRTTYFFYFAWPEINTSHHWFTLINTVRTINNRLTHFHEGVDYIYQKQPEEQSDQGWCYSPFHHYLLHTSLCCKMFFWNFW